MYLDSTYHNLLVKKSCYPVFRVNIECSSDKVLWLRLVEKAGFAHFIAQPVPLQHSYYRFPGYLLYRRYPTLIRGEVGYLQLIKKFSVGYLIANSGYKQYRITQIP